MLKETVNLSKHQKSTSKKQKVFTYIVCALAAVVIALLTAYFVLKWCNNKTLPTSNYSSATSTIATITINDYDIVEIVEPEEDLPSEDNNTSEIESTTVNVEQTESNTITVTPTSIDSSLLTNRQVKLNVNCVLQKPELPTGCEITSLTTVLNYLGYDVSKTTMSDEYLEKGVVGSADFWKVFLGDPRSNGFGCYAQPIVDAANKYMTTQDNKYIAINYSGTQFEELLKEVESGNPVIIWSTMYTGKTGTLCTPYTTYKWVIDGKTIEWIAPEHCMVLIGYDIDRNIAILSDPQRGIVEYNLETVKDRYIALHSQCVILQERGILPNIEGVVSGETYYTTQHITISDNNLKSVTVNSMPYESDFYIEGNKEATYEIVATDKADNKCIITIYTKSISSITESITDINELNVKSENRETVNNIRNLSLQINTDYATQEEINSINKIITNCDLLLDKIDTTNNEYNRIATAVADYDNEVPSQEDISILNQLVIDIDTIAVTENLTLEQQKHLKELKTRCQNLLLLIPTPEIEPTIDDNE